MLIIRESRLADSEETVIAIDNQQIYPIKITPCEFVTSSHLIQNQLTYYTFDFQESIGEGNQLYTTG
ncbi:hypothetical protein JTB14_010843 [Gonioctena quinquepunctata]|nr:hypothetical protein JTB14_010843 [Gonioctena quinquepunctata]